MFIYQCVGRLICVSVQYLYKCLPYTSSWNHFTHEWWVGALILIPGIYHAWLLLHSVHRFFGWWRARTLLIAFQFLHTLYHNCTNAKLSRKERARSVSVTQVELLPELKIPYLSIYLWSGAPAACKSSVHRAAFEMQLPHSACNDLAQRQKKNKLELTPFLYAL